MAWILLLAQLLPSLLKIIFMLRDRIKGMPGPLRRKKLAELMARTRAAVKAGDLDKVTSEVQAFCAELGESKW